MLNDSTPAGYILPQFVNIYTNGDKDSMINNPLVTMTQKEVSANFLYSLVLCVRCGEGELIHLLNRYFLILNHI